VKPTEVTGERPLRVDRGAVVVVVPLRTTDGELAGELRGAVEQRGCQSLVLLLGPQDTVEVVAQELVKAGDEGSVAWLACDAPGEARCINLAARASRPGDLALLLPRVRVGAGWLARLRRAAMSDSTIASASPLLLRDGPVALSDTRGQASFALTVASERVAQGAPRLYPRIGGAAPGCAYIRRPALDLAGPFDEALALESALADFSMRVAASGFVHVVADDALADIPGGVTGRFADGTPVGAVEDTLVRDERGPLRRSTKRAQTLLRPVCVTIDVRALAPSVGGTQTYVLQLVTALAEQETVALRLLTPPDLSDRAADALDCLPHVEQLTYEQAANGEPSLSDVVYRPQQVFTPEDVTLLRRVGERVVICQHDLIAYRNHSYHRDLDSWRSYRRTTRLALAAADEVVFFSDHARSDALREDLVPADRAQVVGIGAEPVRSAVGASVPPRGLSPDDPFLLCLGTDYAHKNRPFAINLLARLRELGWQGRLVLAGPHVPYGSSREHERARLARDPELARLVTDLGTIEEPAKNWLYANARALVYPTLYEGFGLLPVEAASAGLPCLFAAQASLAELAGEAATLVPWDSNASAVAVLPLLSDGQAREKHLDQLRAIPLPSWREVAGELVSVYERCLDAPSAPAAPRMWQELERENYVARLDRDISHLKQTSQEYQDAYHALNARVEAGLPLIDDGGLLTRAQQRGLMRVASRRHLGALALAPFSLLGRVHAAHGTDASSDER
jgi:glycosyltransferase involved in cell wall biosynthesis